jgi:hypothetical protein
MYTLAKNLPKCQIAYVCIVSMTDEICVHAVTVRDVINQQWTEHITAAINSLVDEDATYKVYFIAETFGISSGIIFQIIRQWLEKRKIYIL